MKNLRVLDMSYNKLRTLPDFLFREDSLEYLSLAGNKFERIPYKSFSFETATSLRELDFSRNLITSLHSPDLFSRFKVSTLGRRQQRRRIDFNVCLNFSH